MDRAGRLKKIGFVLAPAGLGVAACSLFPAIVDRSGFPWPLLVGSFIYLHGAFLVTIGSVSADRRHAMGRLRFVRLGFVAVFLLVIWKIVAP